MKTKFPGQTLSLSLLKTRSLFSLTNQWVSIRLVGLSLKLVGGSLSFISQSLSSVVEIAMEIGGRTELSGGDRWKICGGDCSGDLWVCLWVSWICGLVSQIFLGLFLGLMFAWRVWFFMWCSGFARDWGLGLGLCSLCFESLKVFCIL